MRRVLFFVALTLLAGCSTCGHQDDGTGSQEQSQQSGNAKKGVFPAESHPLRAFIDGGAARP